MREIAQNRLYRIGYRKNYTIKGRTLSQRSFHKIHFNSGNNPSSLYTMSKSVSNLRNTNHNYLSKHLFRNLHNNIYPSSYHSSCRVFLLETCRYERAKTQGKNDQSRFQILLQEFDLL